MSRLKDLTGLKLGLLQIIQRVERPNYLKSGGTFWKCRCDCGKEIIATGNNLRRGFKEAKSCGCNRNKIVSKSHRELIGHNSTRWTGYKDITGTAWYIIRYSAKKRKIIFDITLEYLWNLFEKQKRKCALSGLEIYFAPSYRKNQTTASLDRIDSSKGYIEGNVQWVHKDINYMKNNLSEEKLLEYCKLIVKNKKLS